jgi:flagellar hook-associated protein 1
VTQIGSDVQSAQNAQQTAQSLLTAIGNQRQSISGVSLDEEMTNLIQFQQAYQASARVMSTINDTFSSLLSMVSG